MSTNTKWIYRKSYKIGKCPCSVLVFDMLDAETSICLLQRMTVHNFNCCLFNFAFILRFFLKTMIMNAEIIRKTEKNKHTCVKESALMENRSLCISNIIHLFLLKSTYIWHSLYDKLLWGKLFRIRFSFVRGRTCLNKTSGWRRKILFYVAAPLTWMVVSQKKFSLFNLLYFLQVLLIVLDFAAICSGR